MKEGKSIEEILGVLKKYRTIIIVFTVFSILSTGLISYFFITPVYESSTQMLVNQTRGGNVQLDNEDIEADLQLIKTYSDIIESPVVLNKVRDQLGLNLTLARLNNNLTVSNAENSQMVSIKVRDEDPEQAVEIANVTADTFQKEIQTLMNANNVSILSPAALMENPVPVEPKPLLNIVIAAFLGLGAGVGSAFLLARMDTTIKNDHDIREVLEIPVLGLISTIVEDNKSHRMTQEASLNRKEA